MNSLFSGGYIYPLMTGSMLMTTGLLLWNYLTIRKVPDDLFLMILVDYFLRTIALFELTLVFGKYSGPLVHDYDIAISLIHWSRLFMSLYINYRMLILILSNSPKNE